MPEYAAEIIATRVAFLELKDERRLIQEGYELLDEKRVLLAAEIMRQLRRLAALREERARLEDEARRALDAAVAEHGFDDLTVMPKRNLENALLRTDTQTFLGLHLLEAAIEEPEDAPTERPQFPTPEARACEAAFHRLLVAQAPIAACIGNLRRLVREYVRTERRARALENVVLPEIDGSLKFIEEQLDAVDQEEAVRVRNAAHA
jgi:V/A-type H+-transporting ATPase subunit D